MFIAHLPSGYILSVAVLEQIKRARAPATAVLAAGMIGAVAPDFDLAYFYVVDQQQTHHHTYVTHWPLLWSTLALCSWVCTKFWQEQTAPVIALTFGAGGVLHLMLDSVVGDVWWGAPFVDRPFSLFEVHGTWRPWWLNFLLNWSFAAELLICVWAACLYRDRCRSGKGGRPISAA